MEIPRSTNQNLLDILVPLVKLQNGSNLSAVHSLVCYDLNLQNCAFEYGDLMDLDNMDSLLKMHLKQLATLVKSNTDNWLSGTRRIVRSRKKARQQPYFNGVFCEAQRYWLQNLTTQKSLQNQIV